VSDLGRAAMRIAKSGQPVFPCWPEGPKVKRPMTKNGWKDATTDRAQIKKWWTRQPGAAIGIPTGVLWDVLDVDVKPNLDGRVHLVRLTNLGLLRGCQRVVKTPSGGFHLYFPVNPMLKNKARGGTLGLDVRATGGYVIVPPSYYNDTEKGHEGNYVDLGEPVGFTDEVLQWDLIVNELSPKVEGTNTEIDLPGYEQSKSIAGLKHFVSNIKEGERNNGLFWAVNRCIENGFDPHELMDAASLSGLPEEEVLQTINSALTRSGKRVEELTAVEPTEDLEAMFPDEDEVNE
jgi:hypothetical protein